MRRVLAAVAARCARRFGQKADLLVIAHRLQIAARFQADALDSLVTRQTTRSACSSSAWRCVITLRGLWRRERQCLRHVGHWHRNMALLSRDVAERFRMGTVGVAALAANAASFGLLWAFRNGGANMRSA